MPFAPTFDPGAILDARDAGLGHSATARAVLLARLCGTDGDEHDVLDWPLGRRDACLLALRRAWFGERIECEGGCEACGEPIEVAFDAAHISTGHAPGGATIAIEANGREWRARVATSRDLIALERARGADGRAILLHRLLDGSDDPDETAAGAIAAALAARDPQAEVLLDLACPACGTPATLPFDIAAFLWMELDRWAQGMLDDVHILARSYGWSERAILALPAARRAAYIRRAGGNSGRPL